MIALIARAFGAFLLCTILTCTFIFFSIAKNGHNFETKVEVPTVITNTMVAVPFGVSIKPTLANELTLDIKISEIPATIPAITRVLNPSWGSSRNGAKFVDDKISGLRYRVYLRRVKEVDIKSSPTGFYIPRARARIRIRTKLGRATDWYSTSVRMGLQGDGAVIKAYRESGDVKDIAGWIDKNFFKNIPNIAVDLNKVCGVDSINIDSFKTTMIDGRFAVVAKATIPYKDAFKCAKKVSP